MPAPNPHPSPIPAAMIGQVALKLTELATDDLPQVLDLLGRLKLARPAPGPRQRTTAEIRELAKRRAALLADVPREQVAARFEEIVEEIRQEAIEKGTAIDGDWRGD